MFKLKLTPQAEYDLELIYEYTFTTWGESQADKYQDELFAAMELLQKDPELGLPYKHSELDYRMLLVNKHLIFYRNRENECLVVRILHERMNLVVHIEEVNQ